MPKYEFCLIGGGTEEVHPCNKHPEGSRCSLSLKVLAIESDNAVDAHALAMAQVPAGARIWCWWIDQPVTNPEL